VSPWPHLTDERFHNTGASVGTSDAGRYAVTGRNEDRGAFKTPSLRDVARTAPYMHDGSLRTLEDVVDFYDRGGHINPHLDHEVRPLALSSDDKRDLVAFLRALTGSVTEGDGAYPITLRASPKAAPTRHLCRRPR
jgi:cytochrome c peroxidase